MNHFCSICDKKLSRPHRQNANYVMGANFTQPMPTDVHYGIFHNDETESLVNELLEKVPEKDFDSLSAEMANPDAPDTIEIADGMKEVESESGVTETADIVEVPFRIPQHKFYLYEIGSPNAVQNDERLALVVSRIEDREVQITGLVCRDCTPEVEDCCIIWGPDKNDTELDENAAAEETDE